MGRALLLVLLGAAPAFPQAVTQGRTEKGLPWAVVELPGGDAEWVAVWAPPGAPPPAGFEEASAPWGQVWAAWRPALSAPVALAQVLEGVTQAAAVAFVGPVPARELAAALAVTERVTPQQVPKTPCGFADGVVRAVRRDQEGFRWAFPLPPPGDPRFELARPLAWVLEGRFRRLGFTGPVRVEGEACPALVLQHQGGSPRQQLALARERRATLAAPVTAEELSGFFQVQRREATRWAVDPRGVAVAAAERLGLDRPLGPLFFPVEPAPAAVEALLRETLLTYAGQGEVWERERRALPPEQRVLSNGAVLAWRATDSDVGVLAVGLAGLDAQAAQALAQELALAAARAGLPAQTVTFGGMAAVALVGQPEDLVEALEGLVGSVSGASSRPLSPLHARVREALGLGHTIFGENLAVFLSLPEDGEELSEAAEKFLAAVPAGTVRRLVRLSAGLEWQGGEGPAEVMAVVELPSTLAGVVVAEALALRLRAQGLEVDLHNPPGSLALCFGGGGAESLARQEEVLASAWETARLLTSEDTARAWASLAHRMVGSAAQAAMRQALSVFLPTLAQGLRSEPDREEVRQVVAGLPGYKQLPRFGIGPGEPPRQPAGRRARGGVR